MTKSEATMKASDIYGQIYRIRQQFFQPTHIGLGTWGKHLPLSSQAEALIKTLTKERNKYLRLAKKLGN